MTSEHEKVSKLFERAKNGVIVFLHSHARKLSKVLKKGFTEIKKILEGYFPSFAIFFKSPFLRVYGYCGTAEPVAEPAEL